MKDLKAVKADLAVLNTKKSPYSRVSTVKDMDTDTKFYHFLDESWITAFYQNAETHPTNDRCNPTCNPSLVSYEQTPSAFGSTRMDYNGEASSMVPLTGIPEVDTSSRCIRSGAPSPERRMGARKTYAYEEVDCSFLHKYPDYDISGTQRHDKRKGLSGLKIGTVEKVQKLKRKVSNRISEEFLPQSKKKVASELDERERRRRKESKDNYKQVEEKSTVKGCLTLASDIATQSTDPDVTNPPRRNIPQEHRQECERLRAMASKQSDHAAWKYYNAQAAAKIFRFNNCGLPWYKVDLHHLHTWEAENYMLHYLDKVRRTRVIQYGDKVVAIVGKGIHSVNGIPRLGYAVQRLCDDLGLQHVGGSELGHMVINLDTLDGVVLANAMERMLKGRDPGILEVDHVRRDPEDS